MKLLNIKIRAHIAIRLMQEEQTHENWIKMKRSLPPLYISPSVFATLISLKRAQNDLIGCPWPFFHPFQFWRRQMSIWKAFNSSAKCVLFNERKSIIRNQFPSLLVLSYCWTSHDGGFQLHIRKTIFFFPFPFHTSPWQRWTGNPILCLLAHLFLSVVRLVQCGEERSLSLARVHPSPSVFHSFRFLNGTSSSCSTYGVYVYGFIIAIPFTIRTLHFSAIRIVSFVVVVANDNRARVSR